MKYAIQNTSGQWWTGDCWGVIQARAEYNALDDLPATVPEDNLNMDSRCEWWCNSETPLDAGYSIVDTEIGAMVYEVER